MSFDIKLGLIKNYEISINQNNIKNVVNYSNTVTDSETYLENIITNKTFSNSGNINISDFVCAELVVDFDNRLVEKEEEINFFFLVKEGSRYKYVKTKPLDLGLINPSDSSTYIKSTRGLIFSKGSSADAWITYSFPFGGIDPKDAKFIYVVDNEERILTENENVKIDYLEGNIIINQELSSRIEKVVGYFDITPLKIYSNGFISQENVKDKYGYYTIQQHNNAGDVMIDKISDTSYVISTSYNAYICSSDEYFITVDGLNLSTPRYIEKNTPILVEQKFNAERTVNVEQTIPTISKDIVSITTFIKSNNSNIEYFTDYSYTGLFMFKEVDKNNFNILSPTYIPLFKKQDILEIIDNDNQALL